MPIRPAGSTRRRAQARTRAVPARMATAILVTGLILPYFTQAAASDSLPFTSGEIDRILAHGPWPQPAQRDPSNRVSGNPEAVSLGAVLFFSPRLSGNGRFLCASCHEPWRAYSDGRDRGLGIEPLERNTPTVLNVRLNRWFGWDGANDNLWAQSIRPLLDAREMASSARQIAVLIRGDRELSSRYAAAFGAEPPANDEAVLVDVGKALAAYQETLSSERTPFDDFRDALVRRDVVAPTRYPIGAQRGLKIFIGRGRCDACHLGPNFTDGEFHRTGSFSTRGNAESELGRQVGIRKLLASPHSLLGPYNDDPSRAGAARTSAVSAELGMAGAFRTPSLRNASLTAPYMHDGSLATLCEVVQRHPVRVPSGGTPAVASIPESLSTAERQDLVAFLQTLVPVSGRAFAVDASTACP